MDPGRRVAPDLVREVVSPNRRTVLCRTGHRLAGARSLAELTGARWASTSITADAEDEVGAIFTGHGLPAPLLALRSQSALTIMTCVANSDLLAMAPAQWQASPLLGGVLATIEVVKELAALPMALVRRADILPTSQQANWRTCCAADTSCRTAHGRQPHCPVVSLNSPVSGASAGAEQRGEPARRELPRAAGPATEHVLIFRNQQRGGAAWPGAVMAE